MRSHLNKYILAVFISLLSLVNAISSDGKLEKIKSLQKKASSGVIKLDSTSFTQLTSGPRNFSLIVVFTALDARFGCQPCREIDGHYNLVAQSYRKSPAASKDSLFFTILDFTQGREVFQKMGIESAPHIFLYPPEKNQVSEPEYQRFDIRDPKNFDVEEFSIWIGRLAGISFKVTKPLNVSGILTTLTLITLILTVFKLFWERIKPLFFSHAIWSVGSIMFIVNMCSGAMWNRIRNAPYAGATKDGKGIQVISALYLILSILVILLIYRVPKIKDASSQRMTLYLLMGGFLFFDSLLVKVFKMKNGSYPFGLFL